MIMYYVGQFILFAILIGGGFLVRYLMDNVFRKELKEGGLPDWYYTEKYLNWKENTEDGLRN